MKTRISATIDKETLRIIQKLIREKNYRNKSHVIEDAVQKLKKEGKNEK